MNVERLAQANSSTPPASSSGSPARASLPRAGSRPSAARKGYWQVGSRNYQPEEMATLAAFRQMPEEVWAWYLYRRGVCRGAEPNAAHRALFSAERRGGDRFLLVTQNVDGLHLRAGNTLGPYVPNPRQHRLHAVLARMPACAGADAGGGRRCLGQGPTGRRPRAPGAPMPLLRRTRAAARALVRRELRRSRTSASRAPSTQRSTPR